MQNVSQAWKDNQNKQLVSESFVEISFDLTDPDASANATASSNGAVTFSNIDGIVDEVDEQVKRYVTLEPNMWLLDGSGKILPDSILDGVVVEDAGYVGEAISSLNRTFNPQPVITLDFPEVYTTTLPGITITWSEALTEYPTEFKVSIYNDDTVVSEFEVKDNASPVSSLFVDISGYNKIEITVVKWCLPYHRARVENILLGAKKVYSKNDIFAYSHSQEMDIISSELPKNTISFEINNINREYDPDNASGLSKYLTERQQVKVRYGHKLNDGVEWIDGGTFFLSEWVAEANGNSVKFTADSLFDFLDIIYTQSQYYESGRSLYDLAIDVLTFADIPLLKNGDVRWYVDESLRDIISLAPLPKDSVANCLQFIANAGECLIKYDRNGILRIEKSGGVDDEYVVDSYNSYEKPESALSKPVKQVEVNMYTPLVVDHSDGDSSVASWTTLKRGECRELPIGQKFIIEHEQAAVNKSLFNSKGSVQLSLLSECLYKSEYLISNITSDASLATFKYALRGQHLELSSLPVSVMVSNEGESITVDNPLITSNEQALSVGQWVKESMLRRQTRSISWRADPRLDVGDIVENTDAYGTVTLFITKIDYTYNGAFKATAEGRVM